MTRNILEDIISYHLHNWYTPACYQMAHTQYNMTKLHNTLDIKNTITQVLLYY